MDEFTRAYVECALWSSTGDDGDPLDGLYTIDDIAERTLAEMATDCKDFVQGLPQRLYDVITGMGAWSRAGADFWLTRNRHGAGFWDGDWPGDAGERLTEAAHAYGSYNLYVSEDGLVHSASEAMYDEPQEGDYLTDDHISWREAGTGHLLLKTANPADPTAPADDWRAQVRGHMDSQQFWPSAWRIGERGDANLIDLNGQREEDRP